MILHQKTTLETQQSSNSCDMHCLQSHTQRNTVATTARIKHTQADILQMEPPELYVRQNPTPNAYTLAISGRKPFIVVHTSLLELLSPPELQAVLAHGALL